jgi:hypothetical protein
MSEQDAAHYRDAERIAGTEEIRTPTGSTSGLSEIAADVRAGNVYSVPWEFFRFVALRQAPHKQARSSRARW